jgi:hypothetical protein
LVLQSEDEVPDGLDGLCRVGRRVPGLRGRIVDVGSHGKGNHQAGGLPNHSHDAHATPFGFGLHWTTMTMHCHRNVAFRVAREQIRAAETSATRRGHPAATMR